MRCPTLALFGAKDLQVDPGQNVEPLREAFSEGGFIEPAVEVLSGHNHLFQRCGTGSPSEYKQIEETFSPIALGAIEDWIKANVLR